MKLKKCVYILASFFLFFSSFVAYAKSHEWSSIINYRGRRKLLEEETSVYLKEVNVKTKEEEPLVVDLFFSGKIDPLSVFIENIYINDFNISEYESELAFNREGTQLRISVENEFTFPLIILIKEIRLGTEVEESVLSVPPVNAKENLIYDKDEKQWKKY